MGKDEVAKLHIVMLLTVGTAVMGVGGNME
jgi:hypothetical protein